MQDAGWPKLERIGFATIGQRKDAPRQDGFSICHICEANIHTYSVETANTDATDGADCIYSTDSNDESGGTNYFR